MISLMHLSIFGRTRLNSKKRSNFSEQTCKVKITVVSERTRRPKHFHFFGGVATRCMLNQQSKLRGQMMAGVAFFSCAVVFAWWFLTARAVHGFALSPLPRTLVTFQLGQFGFGLATKFKQLFPGKFATLREE